MAEPLTSSDVWRIERGWGTSGLASPEERKRFYGAGELPISGLDARRLAEGRGISPMASRAEKEAWVASEVMLGKRGAEDLPEFYGGMGERPSAAKTGFYSTGEETAYGRRRRRMQEDFDARMKLQMEQENLARQTEIENRRLLNSEENLLLQQRQEARLQAAETKAKEEAFKISDDADRAMAEALGGGFDMAGNPISGLNPDSDDYTTRRSDILKRYKKAANDDAFKLMLSDLDKKYIDRINFDQSFQISEAQQKSSLAKELALVGKSIVDFTENGKINFEAANTALGEALRKKEEGKEAATDEREQKRILNRQKASAETELIKIKAQVGRFQNLRPTEQNQKELNAALVSQGIFEDEINRINRELGEEPQAPVQPQSFDTPEQAEAAKLPKGTIVVIGGRRARID